MSDAGAETTTTDSIFDAEFVVLACIIFAELCSKLPSRTPMDYLNIMSNVFGNKCNDGCLQLNTMACPRLKMDDTKRKALCDAIIKLCKSSCFPSAVPMVIANPGVMAFGNRVATDLVHNFVGPQYQNTPWAPPAIAPPPFPMTSNGFAVAQPTPAYNVIAQPSYGMSCF
jgi:hypothetical protein